MLILFICNMLTVKTDLSVSVVLDVTKIDMLWDIFMTMLNTITSTIVQNNINNNSALCPNKKWTLRISLITVLN